jgi:NAD(P)-dependent dehydrogenase (short-subunit alcohol dehydrogenase family)
MKTRSSVQVALVTGSNRGIGFEICRQLAKKEVRVILAARDAAKGRAAAAKLKSEGLDVDFAQLDVSDEASVKACLDVVRREYGRLDILVNNAGVMLDRGESAFDERVEVLRETMETNVYGAFRMCQAFIPLMREGGHGRVVNISSGMGQLNEMNGGYPAYRISKTALNAITRIFADETQGTDIQVNSVCPGWVRTDMGGSGATLTPEQGADTATWLALQPKGAPTGSFFRERERIEW